MYTILLYVALCTFPTTCDSYEPASWSVSSEQEEQLAFERCASLEREYMKKKGELSGGKQYRESDCYYAE